MNPVYDLAYRIVAIAVCVWCGRRAWQGYVERKITVFNTDWLDWWTPSQVFQRDAAPIRYWLFLSGQAGSAVMCLIAAIIGWQPNV